MGEKCEGTNRRTGDRCGNKPEAGSKFCRYHGGGNQNAAGRPPESVAGLGYSEPGNLHAYRHGAYTSRLPPDEQPLFDAILEAYSAELENPTATDRMGLQRLAMFETKLQRAVELCAPPDAVETLSRLIHQELKALKLTRATKDGGKALGKTAAEVIQALLMRAATVRNGALEGPSVGGRLLQAAPAVSVTVSQSQPDTDDADDDTEYESQEPDRDDRATTQGRHRDGTGTAQGHDSERTGSTQSRPTTASSEPVPHHESADDEARRQKNVVEHLAGILASRPTAKPSRAKKVAEDDLCDIF